MDFFNQTIAQARELFASMTPGARVTAALLMGVVVISLAFLFKQGTTGPDEYLFGEPQAQSQIARMSAAMAQEGIEHEIEGNFLRVPRGQRLLAMAAIADAGELPADVNQIMSEALDRGSVFDSREVKEQRIKAAKERRLSKIISLHPWVDQAYVTFEAEEARGLKAGRSASAAVSIMPVVGEALETRRLRNLKALVAKTFNIDPMSVTIQDLNGGVAGADGLTPDDFDQPYYVTKARIEQRYRESLMRLLGFIKGVGVEVNAILDNVEEQRVLQVKPEKDTAVITSRSIADKTEQLSASISGRPGLDAQGPGRPGADEGPAPQDRKTTTLEDEAKQHVVGSTQEERLLSGYNLKEAWASVRVPRSHVVAVYRQRMEDSEQEIPNPIPANDLAQLEGEIKGSIQELIEYQLPRLSLGEDELKQASIVFYDDLKQPEIEPPSATSDALALLGAYWNSIAMGGLAIVSLVMLRSMVMANSTGGASGRLGKLQFGESDQDEQANAAGSGEESDERPKLKLKKAETLKDDLTEMVASDPDAAAAILRSWINNAA